MKKRNIIPKYGRIDGLLAVSRSIGDMEFLKTSYPKRDKTEDESDKPDKPDQMIREAYCSQTKISKNDKFLLLFCDGVKYKRI